MPLPDFIGIGAPKAGTTWLYRCLDEHPDVFVPTHKEPYFFDYDTIDGRWDEYEVHFAGSEGFPAVGEISTRYLASRRAPARIQEHIPDARLFVSLRNPVDQVYSHYWHLRRQNFHQWDRSKVPDSFKEALEMYPEKLLEPAFYHKHLQRWLACFDRSQLHIIFYDDICERPGQALSELFTFLEVDPDFTPPSLNRSGSSVRHGVAPREKGLGRLYTLLYDVLNRKFYNPLKQLIGVKQAVWLKDGLRVRWLMEHLFMGSGYPQMDHKTCLFLARHFEADIQALADLAERNLSAWELTCSC